MKVIFLAMALIKSLDFIYLLQIKEYRVDRFKAFLTEEGIGRIFYFRFIRLPALSIRNIGITLISFLILILITMILNDVELIHFLILPAFSFLAVGTGVVLTALPVSLYRRIKIAEAKKVIDASRSVRIGITGSFGKTSVKEFLYHILSSKFRTAKTEKNMNSDIGVALSIIKNVKKDTQFFIAEMGAYKKGEIRKICELTHPKIGIVTAIGNQHLDLFGSVEWLVSAKSELVESLPKKGALYINEKIRYYEEIVKKTKCEVVSYSLDSKADITAEKISGTETGSNARVYYKNKAFDIKTALLGKHNILNLLPAIAIATDAGMTEEEITRAIFTLKPVSHRLEVKSGTNSATVLDDSYNSNVEGFLTGIDVAESFSLPKTIIVSRGIIELGEQKKSSYKKIVNRIKPPVELWTTDPHFQTVDNEKNVKIYKSEKELLKDILTNLNQRTVLLVEGKFPLPFLTSLGI